MRRLLAAVVLLLAMWIGLELWAERMVMAMAAAETAAQMKTPAGESAGGFDTSKVHQ